MEKRIIDAELLLDDLDNSFSSAAFLQIQRVVNRQPTEDAVPVVRCRDCKWSRHPRKDIEPEKFYRSELYMCCHEKCGGIPIVMQPDGYCSLGKEKVKSDE